MATGLRGVITPILSVAARNWTILAAAFQPPFTQLTERNREEAQVLTFNLASKRGSILVAIMAQSATAANTILTTDYFQASARACQ